ncbi:hypothetical protein J3A83DRAFT_4367186 [Scleroderma citrinum]
MEKVFPLFKFVENGWKLEYICTKMYPAWSKCYLDKNRKLKHTTCDAVKEETLNESEENCKPSSKKQRTDTETEESCSKKVETVDTILAAHPLKPITLTHTQSLRPLWPTDHAKVYSPLELATPVEPPTLGLAPQAVDTNIEAIVQASDGQESPIVGSV